MQNRRFSARSFASVLGGVVPFAGPAIWYSIFFKAGSRLQRFAARRHASAMSSRSLSVRCSMYSVMSAFRGWGDGVGLGEDFDCPVFVPAVAPIFEARTGADYVAGLTMDADDVNVGRRAALVAGDGLEDV